MGLIELEWEFKRELEAIGHRIHAMNHLVSSTAYRSDGAVNVVELKAAIALMREAQQKLEGQLKALKESEAYKKEQSERYGVASFSGTEIADEFRKQARRIQDQNRPKVPVS